MDGELKESACSSIWRRNRYLVDYGGVNVFPYICAGVHFSAGTIDSRCSALYFTRNGMSYYGKRPDLETL